MDYRKKFSDNLKILRNENKVSQRVIAEKLKISRAIVSYWENGQREPTLSSLIALADFFNCSIDYLVGRED